MQFNFDCCIPWFWRKFFLFDFCWKQPPCFKSVWPFYWIPYRWTLIPSKIIINLPVGTCLKRSQHRRCFVLPPIGSKKNQDSHQIHTLLLPKGSQDLMVHSIINSLFTSYFFLLWRTKVKVFWVSFLVFPDVQGLLYRNLCKTQHYSQIDIFGINTLEIHYLTAPISFGHQWKWKSGVSNLSKKI